MNQTPYHIALQLGLSESEADTFSALVRFPQGISVVQLARVRNMPRSSLYTHIDALVEKGLVKKGMRNDESLFFVESPKHIEALFTERIHTLARAQESVHDVFARTEGVPSYDPKLFFYKKHAAELVLRDVLHSGAKEMLWLWPIKDMLETLPVDFYEYFHKERIKKGIFLKTIWPERAALAPHEYPFAEIETNEKNLRETRILPADIGTLLGYGVYGNKVGFISTKREGFGFIIDSYDLSETIRAQFFHWWSIAMPLEKCI